MATFQDAINSAQARLQNDQSRPGYINNTQVNGSRHHIYPWRDLVNTSLTYLAQNLTNAGALEVNRLAFMQAVATTADQQGGRPRHEQAMGVTWLNWVDGLQANNIEDFGNLGEDLLTLLAWQPWNIVLGLTNRPNGDPGENFDAIANNVSNNRFGGHAVNIPTPVQITAHMQDPLFDGMNSNLW